MVIFWKNLSGRSQEANLRIAGCVQEYLRVLQSDSIESIRVWFYSFDSFDILHRIWQMSIRSSHGGDCRRVSRSHWEKRKAKGLALWTVHEHSTTTVNGWDRQLEP